MGERYRTVEWKVELRVGKKKGGRGKNKSCKMMFKK